MKNKKRNDNTEWYMAINRHSIMIDYSNGGLSKVKRSVLIDARKYLKEELRKRGKRKIEFDDEKEI